MPDTPESSDELFDALSRLAVTLATTVEALKVLRAELTDTVADLRAEQARLNNQD